MHLGIGSWIRILEEGKNCFLYPRRLYVMPFGLTNAPATFQRLMKLVLADILIWRPCLLLMIQSASWKLSLSWTYVQQFQRDLSLLSHWSVNIHLSFSIPKFVFMCYHNKFNSEYTINGNAIPHSSSCKDLGINFSDNLTWRLHYQNVTSKTYKSFSLLCHIFKDNYCPETRKNSYYNFHTCGSPTHYINDIELIKRVQKQVTKHIHGDYNSDYNLRLTIYQETLTKGKFDEFWPNHQTKTIQYKATVYF